MSQLYQAQVKTGSSYTQIQLFKGYITQMLSYNVILAY